MDIVKDAPATIRPYQEHDIPYILSVIKRAFAEHQGKITPPSSAEQKTVAILKEELKTASALVAETEGKLVGCIFYQPDRACYYLNRLAVLPEYQGRGIATVLMGAVENEVRSLGGDCLTLSVRLSLEKQQILYRRLGFEFLEYGTHPGYTEPTYMTMRKMIAIAGNR